MIDLEAIRARDACVRFMDYATAGDVDRRALLQYVDELLPKARDNDLANCALQAVRDACKEIMGGNLAYVDDDFARCLLTLRDENAKLREAAGKVTCRRCDDSGFEPWSGFGGAVIEPCPDCTDLRKLLEGER